MLPDDIEQPGEPINLRIGVVMRCTACSNLVNFGDVLAHVEDMA
jgi:hypothetical protein